MALTYQPPPVNNFSIAGDMTFNTGQTFKIGSTYDLFSVAIHEFGHTLGLGHEYSHCARMNAVVDYDGTPEYCRSHTMSYWLKHALKGDDVHGARALYSSSFRKSSASRPHALPSLVGNVAAPAWATGDLPLFGDSELAAALTG